MARTSCRVAAAWEAGTAALLPEKETKHEGGHLRS